MKCTIINCDMCGCRIYKNGHFRVERGVVTVRARALKWFGYCHKWKRQKYHICPQCVDKIKEYCSGEVRANDGGVQG